MELRCMYPLTSSSFTQFVCKIHPLLCVLRVYSVLLLRNIHCMELLQFIYSLVDGQLDCFQFLSIKN